MKKLAPGFIVCFCLYILSSCVKNSAAATADICDANRSTLEVATNLSGRMTFDQVLEQWVITSAVAGTIDASKYCIICGDLPPELKREGVQVIFSGLLKNSNGYPRPRVGGQEIFYVRPTAIKKAG